MIRLLPRPGKNHLHNLLQSDSPNFEDLGISFVEAEALAGINIAENNYKKHKKNYNFKSVIVGTLVFLIILVWFDYFQTVFYELTSHYIEDTNIPSNLILAFASFSTIICILIIVAIIIFP